MTSAQGNCTDAGSTLSARMFALGRPRLTDLTCARIGGKPLLRHRFSRSSDASASTIEPAITNIPAFFHWLIAAAVTPSRRPYPAWERSSATPWTPLLPPPFEPYTYPNLAP